MARRRAGRRPVARPVEDQRLEVTRLINFRCWYCNRHHSRDESRTGETFACACEYTLRVPSRSGGNCRVFTLTDWLVTCLVYGGGGALLGFGLALVLLAKLFRGVTMTTLSVEAAVLGGLTLLGFLLGIAFGESGANWIGRRIRNNEDLPR